ncbi:subtilisin-like protease SBT1.4 [Canna indica]|uniref:Subtilisin-like protease SBT1.4 n=1 Tax=Canna indica TaxID=4628 RepID=A0AAQ3KKH8_9LILI|nr:subtilisin-like protease SBT1.4 [Canna indica]
MAPKFNHMRRHHQTRRRPSPLTLLILAGLVYDVPIDDYIAYICTKFGCADTIVRDRSVDCSKVKKMSESELNLPSIILERGSTINRMVTNVGPASSSYEVKVDVPASMAVTVTPKTLVFTQANQKMSFHCERESESGPPTNESELTDCESSLCNTEPEEK